jgi:hypothetical protein
LRVWFFRAARRRCGISWQKQLLLLLAAVMVVLLLLLLLQERVRDYICSMI